MKQKILTLALTLALILSPCTTARAEDDPGGGAPEGPPYFNEPNAAIASLADQLPLVMVLSYNDHGTFWQGPKLPEITPTQGQPVTPTMSRAADGHASWAGAGIVLSDTVDYSLQVDIYEFPYGWGYSITCEFYSDGDLWQTVYTYGQENIEGGHGWQIIND